MFRFLMGVAFGAAGYWAWQSFCRDLLGMGGDQETTYGGFNSTSTPSASGGPSGTFGSTTTSPASGTTSSSPGGASGSTTNT